MSNVIEIISWNVNGIRAVTNKEALKWIDERDTDILCLQEIKAQKEQIPNNLFEKEFSEVIINSGEEKDIAEQQHIACCRVTSPLHVTI